MRGSEMTIMRKALLAAAVTLAAALPAAAQQTQSNFGGLKISGDQPIQIESDKLEVRDTDGVAIFTGNVNVVQGPTLMRAGRMTVYYAKGAAGGAGAGAAASATPGSGNIDKLEVDGKVYVKSETQVATADKATFDMGTEILVMTGNEVVLTDGPNVIVGCRLTVRMGTGEATLDGCGKGGQQDKGGRVKMLLQPKATQ
ncbi:LPS ABC transporter substrate-binding protein LptA [Aquibium carbonis]|uniref:LPS ABC transporter substrate-binding protein LptA n=1 Tax=Aquibium carbonis TaxID=2495581 RepID=A0A429YG09_9HYPH|nr:LptA/OstA family protein [Aquibium carbonis]RST80380.1 LPS ABC transporter substrate-binding protein LptA [Aquibium carbonis]